MDNWNDYSIDAIMTNIEEPSSWVMDDDQFAGYIAELPEEVLDDKPVKMDFRKLFKLKLTREKYIKKFGINQQHYEVKVANLPYHLGNNASMRVLPELFTAKNCILYVTNIFSRQIISLFYDRYFPYSTIVFKCV